MEERIEDSTWLEGALAEVKATSCPCGWQGGFRILKYEITPDPEMQGNDFMRVLQMECGGCRSIITPVETADEPPAEEPIVLQRGAPGTQARLIGSWPLRTRLAGRVIRDRDRDSDLYVRPVKWWGATRAVLVCLLNGYALYEVTYEQATDEYLGALVHGRLVSDPVLQPATRA